MRVPGKTMMAPSPGLSFWSGAAEVAVMTQKLVPIDDSRRMNDEVMSKTSHHYNFPPTIYKISIKSLAVVLKSAEKRELRRRGIKYEDGLVYLKD
ncbi:hypothetical protein DUI87_12908 [Hirundo rustica rustica]|uniref:Uncharacterized protein n=1 Tax=Hirundo rustica rustica TaxID=333673 RepID=A0A3M0KGH8_HIRRU|nr:hypothetical protein DUI87_12908 [Hirundo rustica rustica]